MSIAVSEDIGELHEPTDRYLPRILSELIEKPLKANQIWNVNFPSGKLADCKGILYDRTVSLREFYKDKYNLIGEKGDRQSYMVEGTRVYNAEEGSDLRALFDGYVSVGIATNIS